MTLKIGAKVPNSGPLPETIGIGAMARMLEGAGFESLWVSDHVVMPVSIESRYPFASDGRATWSSETPYFDALISLALIAAATERATIGTAVLVLPLRNPVVAAKQAASIDVVSGGRLELGVGAGWLREEFDALNAPFDGRGARLDEWMRIARACWTGRPHARSSEWFELPENVICLPTPAHDVPFLVGGHSQAALRRAGRLGDGWLAQQSLPEIAPDTLREASRIMRAAAIEAGRDPARLRVVLRIVASAGRSSEVAQLIPTLSAAGVDEIIVDVPWDDAGPEAHGAMLRDAAAA